MSRALPTVVILSVLAGLAFAHVTRSPGGEGALSARGDRVSSSRVVAREKSPTERFDGSIDAKPGTQRELGEFRLAGERSLRLYSVETRNGRSCLVDVDSSVGQSAGCLEGGLFGARRAAFSVNTQGGPDRFDELYLVGVAAPDIEAVDLVQTNGSLVRLELNPQRAFLFLSRSADLEARIYPTALRLHGPGGRLAETITFPPAG